MTKSELVHLLEDLPDDTEIIITMRYDHFNQWLDMEDATTGVPQLFDDGRMGFLITPKSIAEEIDDIKEAELN